MLKISLFVAVSAVTLSTAAPARPPIVIEGRNATQVSYADLNLASPSGRSALDERIRSAAKKLCIDRGVAELERVMIGRDCFADAIASAQPQLNVALSAARDVGDKRIMLSLRR